MAGKYELYGMTLVKDDSSLAAFAACIYDGLPLETGPEDPEERKDYIMDLVRESVFSDLSRTDFDAEELLFRYREEIGDLLYRMDKEGLNIPEICFFGEGAETFFYTVVYDYILVHYDELSGALPDGSGESPSEYPNTEIDYLYRDGCNYKLWNKVIVSGTFRPEDIDTVIGCLWEGEFFIPSQVGFPEERFPDWTLDDTEWFEMDRSAFVKTKNAPTIDMTAGEVVKRFVECKDCWLLVS